MSEDQVRKVALVVSIPLSVLLSAGIWIGVGPSALAGVPEGIVLIAMVMGVLGSFILGVFVYFITWDVTEEILHWRRKRSAGR